MRASSAVFLVVIVALAGCRRPSSPPAVGAAEAAQERARQIAATAANELAAALMSELQTAMHADGPIGAIAVCAARAQELTSEVEARFAEDGLRIRRTAQRVRNPLNAADEWEKQWMDHAAASIRDTGAISLASVDEQGRDEIRYLRPLLLGEACLACHGPREQITPEVLSILAERYPEDKATGFRVGEFRGMISVRVPLLP